MPLPRNGRRLLIIGAGSALAYSIPMVIGSSLTASTTLPTLQTESSSSVPIPSTEGMLPRPIRVPISPYFKEQEEEYHDTRRNRRKQKTKPKRRRY